MTYLYDGNQESPLPEIPEEPKKPRRKRKRRFVKKAGALVLSGLLFGAAAAAAFQGVNTWMGNDSMQAASNHTETEASTTQAANSGSVLRTATSSSDGVTDSQSLDVSDVAEGVMSSVVAITRKSVQEVQNYYSMFGRGGSGSTQEVESQGSGIIIGENGTELLVVTNNHVVEGATTLSVSFIDNSVYEATIKGTDSSSDLAVISVPLSAISEDTLSQIKAAQIGNSDDLKVGEQVVAIGNALGYGQSVTTGIVSALNRQIETTDVALIQTDAAINPGNSGGALINMKGEVVGINSAKYASTEVEGMGYAIPISAASPIIEELMNQEPKEKVSEDQASYLGVSGESITSEMAAMYGFPEGIYVTSVTAGGPAEAAGVQTNSIITKFDGTSISGISELKSLLEYYAAGETVELTVMVAQNGSYVEQTLTVTLGSAAAVQR